ncbi:MAG TPA: NAD(P)-dependent oxidoreductase [Kiloniellales bacterium]|jgi:3-hydroxyisobutyrate dehydrogenase-like beta-hydroxyacid dehydrogenase|nr:NAD(P)-dependent oxidoreductase [Kiloniellales bacterium]
MTEAVGFIGLGLMGTGFTSRLLAAGYKVVGFDLDEDRRQQAQDRGVEVAASASEVAMKSDTMAICVTTTAAVAAVVEELAGSGQIEGKRIIDFSTTEMETTQKVAALMAEAGGHFIDAPVSGGPPAAEAGTLAIMAGGDTQAVEAARPLLETLGRLTHMGPTGAGQATKLVNQALCLTNYCIVAEGLRLAEAYGVDARKVPEALEPGLGNSAVLQNIFPRMVERDYAPRGYARQILKDLEMLHEATRKQHIAMPMAATATTLFRLLVAQGHSELDGAAVVTLYPEPDKS